MIKHTSSHTHTQTRKQTNKQTDKQTRTWTATWIRDFEFEKCAHKWSHKTVETCMTTNFVITINVFALWLITMFAEVGAVVFVVPALYILMCTHHGGTECLPQLTCISGEVVLGCTCPTIQSNDGNITTNRSEKSDLAGFRKVWHNRISIITSIIYVFIIVLTKRTSLCVHFSLR